MYPWLWVFAPHLNLPGSGSVSQWIEPDTNWFFGAIPASAGNGRVEKKAFDVASYGRQLGLLAEVLIDLADKESASLSPEAAESLDRLKGIQARIEQIKIDEAGALDGKLEAQLTQMRDQRPAEFAALLARVAPPPARRVNR